MSIYLTVFYLIYYILFYNSCFCYYFDGSIICLDRFPEQQVFLHDQGGNKNINKNDNKGDANINLYTACYYYYYIIIISFSRSNISVLGAVCNSYIIFQVLYDFLYNEPYRLTITSVKCVKVAMMSH